MRDLDLFAGVEVFARQHGSCGGFTPTVEPQANGGYRLTVVCACGAQTESFVSSDTALSALPSTAASPPSTPDPSSARPEPPPAPSGGTPAEPRYANAEREPADAGRTAPTRPAASPPGPPRRSEWSELSRDAPKARPATGQFAGVIRNPVESYRVGPPPGTVARKAENPYRLTVWLGVFFGALLVAGGVAMWLVASRMNVQTARPPVPATAPQPAPVVTPTAPPLSEEDRASLDTAVWSVRQLQSISLPGNTLPFYRSRVDMMENNVRPLLDSGVPIEVRSAVRDLLEIHRAAVAAWEAGATAGGESADRAVPLAVTEMCASVADPSEPPSESPSGPPPVVQRLWQCSAEKVVGFDRLLGG